MTYEKEYRIIQLKTRRDRQRQQNKEYYERNKEKIKEYNKNYRAERKEQDFKKKVLIHKLNNFFKTIIFKK